MYRARGLADGDVDFDAVAEIVARVRRLSSRMIVGSLLIGVALGILAVVLTLDTYNGPGGKILGARLGFTFCVALAGAIGLGIALRKLLLRWRLPRWINEMVALGVDGDTLREAIASFID